MVNKYYLRNKFLSFYSAVSENGSLWVANSCFNGLFRMKEDGTEIEYIAPLDDNSTNIQKADLYSNAVLYKRQIFFLPSNTCDVSVFDLDQKIIKHIRIPGLSDAESYLIAGYSVYGEYLYLFSCFAHCSAVRIHLETFKIEKLPIWEQIVRRYYNTNEKYFLANAVQIEDSVWMGIQNTNKIIKYSLQNGACEELESSRKILKEFGNEYLQELYIVSGDGKEIECIDLKDQKNRSKLDLSSFIEKDNRILEILSDEEELVVIPIYEKYIIVVNRRMGNIIKYQNFPREFKSFNGNNRFFYKGNLTEKYIELFPYFSNGMIRIERQSGEMEFYRTEISCENLKLHCQSFIHKSICYESLYSLNIFLDVLEGERCEKETADLVEENGRRIAQYVMHEVGEKGG